MNKFNLSHTKLLSGFMGNLIPITWFEALPGDIFRHKTDLFVRTQPLLAPLMHMVNARIHHFFVPYRLIWDDFEKFITGGEDGLDASVAPTITVNTGTGYALNSLADYLGLPTGVDDITHSALPFRAYALIFNEYFRDQQLTPKIAVSTASGTDTTTNTSIKNVCWEKDYFTSARPDPVLGTEVTVPIGDIVTNSQPITLTMGANTNKNFRVDANDFLFADGPGSAQDVKFGNESGLQTDPVTINELRRAFAIQRWQEARNLYGGRYTEYLAHIGVRAEDSRLQRPEYLAGGKRLLQFSEVVQTGGTSAGAATGVGNLRGHGVGAMSSNRYKKFIPEHGLIMTMLSILPKTLYMEGIHRSWSKTSKFDYFQKELESIGQQEVYNKELYAAHTTPTGVFGYQDRYDEYRRIESTIAGDFRSTLNYWHMGRDFSSDPTLNSAFVTADPTTRIYPATSEAQLYIMSAHDVQAVRQLKPRAYNKIL